MLFLLSIVLLSLSRPKPTEENPFTQAIERPPMEKHISQQLTPTATTAALNSTPSVESKKLTPKVREISDNEVLKSLSAPKN